MRLSWKRLRVPLTNETRTIETVQLWEVRWTSRSGAYSGETRPEVEGFLTERAARDFAVSLEQAWKLLRCTGEGTNVSLRARALR